tara:strand:- start:2610 stop:2741 length:132 start_codon:yes stop_codon:yes gene_type:complete
LNTVDVDLELNKFGMYEGEAKTAGAVIERPAINDLREYFFIYI